MLIYYLILKFFTMRILETKVYTFEELSESAKQKAISEYLYNGFEYHWMEENIETLNKFADLFDIKISVQSLDSNCCDVRYRLSQNNDILELKGIRLLKYLMNNFYNDLFKPEFRSMGKLRLTDKPIKHKRVKSSLITANCTNKGKYSNSYYSAISKSNSCVLTGYCLDDTILQPIYNFLKEPCKNTSFEDLTHECISSFETSVKQDCEYQESEEAIIDTILANNYEFTEEGKLI